MIKFKKIKYSIIILFVAIYASNLYGQEDYIVNHSKFMQKTNPSYFGFNKPIWNLRVLKMSFKETTQKLFFVSNKDIVDLKEIKKTDQK